MDEYMDDDRMDDGRLEQVGGRWQLRFTRRLSHPPEKVWRAITESEHLATWVPADIVGERAAGASLRFVFRNNEGPPIDGAMIRYDPPSVFEFRWGEDTFRFDLEPDGDGCVLSFVNTFAELGKAARDAAGWHICLDLLGYHLAGKEAPWTPEKRWIDVHDTYVDRFPPEAATIGPPEGRDPRASG
jgi:uncharacterized protein YndB with AHSA1/START domain